MLPFWETNVLSKQSRTIPQTWAINPWCKRWGINGILRIGNFPFLFFASKAHFGWVKASHHPSKGTHEKRIYANVLQRNQVKNFEHWTSYCKGWICWIKKNTFYIKNCNIGIYSWHKRGIELYSNKINLLKLETPSTSYPAHLFAIKGRRRREIFQNCSGDEVGIPCSKIPHPSPKIF